MVSKALDKSRKMYNNWNFLFVHLGYDSIYKF